MKTLIYALILPVAFAVTVIAQGRGGGPAAAAPAVPPLVKEGATVKLAPHSYAIPDHNVGQVPNVGIVVGSRATLVIDPGMGRRNGETVLREVQKLTKNAEMYVATTHYHVEHTLGYLGLPNARYINSTTQDAEFLEGWEQQAKAFASRGPVHAELLQGATGRKADVSFEREHTLDLGEVRVRIMLVGPTHTRGDTIFFVEGDNVLYAGDVVMNESFVIANQNSSMKAWLTAFDLLEKMRPVVIVPSHGKVGDGSLIATNRRFMLEIQARARALKSQGRPIDEVAETVQKEMQAKYPAFARVNGVAGAARAAYNEAS
jgi:glyoxylase-like metal-dependent hydrolase (beta-lactamase superfamily II)